MLKKLLKAVVLTLLAFLLQTTLSSQITIGDVAPNIALAMVAVVTVGWGKKYTFAMSVTIGYLMEILLPALDYISLVLYPVAAMLASIFLADKSERKLEELKASGRSTKQWNPHVRTPLAALLSILVYEGVHLFYIFLNGVTIGSTQIGRFVISVVYTTLLCALLQFPMRKFMGVYKVKKAR